MRVDDITAIDLPRSQYLGPYNPRTGVDYLQPHLSAEQLWSVIDNRLDDGVAPRVVNVPVDSLLATQDWIGGEGGHGVEWSELKKYPVILQRGNKLLIIDGHHRVTQSRDSGADTVKVYLFK